MSKLHHLKTSNVDVFLPGPMPALRSLDVCWIDKKPTQVASLTALLTASATTLKSLALCLTAITVLALEQLALDIPALTQPIAAALSKVLDLSRGLLLDLRTLRAPKLWPPFPDPRRDSGPEARQRELVGNAALRCLYVDGPADMFVASYKGLEELCCEMEVFYVRVLAGHGETLRRLLLVRMQGLMVEEVCGMAEGCPNIEDQLKMLVLDGDYESLSASIATLRKRHTLSLTI
ncbi:uncharacterized protein H6S33_012717 [Morchella sextelata]|uniref:uncharacterized protein n=1 Tax=Morchella sextelata TaxID=1174677 RepID=UPI001D048270|nr:uncharacterized protein H6S33_012717 [Morchella sextelata]KAH0609231.1 hypothetical protein H6S33_012717 [Morchella sextelata]